MPDPREIYNHHAIQYERLVSREDCQGNIPRALKALHPLEGQRVVELGAGTGRLTQLLAPWVRDIWLFDASSHMLQVAFEALGARGARNWGAAVADHRSLPLVDGVADVAIAGWSVCYLAVWGGAAWGRAVERALHEMERVLGRRGIMILLETLGTGYERPEIPDKLKDYYKHLETAGFKRTWIRTDFQFESLEEAKELTGFFFGDQLAERVEAERWVRVPECTGIWYKRVG